MIKRLLLLIVSVSIFNALEAQDMASTYKPKNQTENLIIAKIRSLPEVKDFFNYEKNYKPDFMIGPPDKSETRYRMQIGTDLGDSFRTYFWLMIDPKTFQVYYWDFAAFGGLHPFDRFEVAQVVGIGDVRVRDPVERIFLVGGRHFAVYGRAEVNALADVDRDQLVAIAELRFAKMPSSRSDFASPSLPRMSPRATKALPTRTAEGWRRRHDGRKS